VAGKLSTWSRQINSKGIEWISAVKRGMNSSVREDIHTSTIEKFNNYIHNGESK